MTTAARSLVCLLMLTATAMAAEPTTARAPVDDIEKRINAKLPAFKVQGMPLKDVLDFIRDVSGVSITVDQAALKSAKVSEKSPISLDEADLTVKAALDAVAAQLKGQQGIVADVVGHRVILSTPQRLEAAHKQYAIDALKTEPKELVRRLPELNFNAIGLTDVIDFLRDVTGASIFVEWKSVEAAGVKRTAPITLRVRDMPFREALRAVLDDTGAGARQPLDFTVDDKNVITIAPAAGEK